MKKVRLESGFIATMLDGKEQDVLWRELSEDVSVIGKNIALETPHDNLKYFIDSEVETSFEKFEAVIRANKKTFKVRFNICNQDSKIYAAVRNAYQN